MVDHHVDRPEVEGEQSLQLTGTNRSIGLSVRIQRQASPRGSAYAVRGQPNGAPDLTRGPQRGGRPFSRGGTSVPPGHAHNSLPSRKQSDRRSRRGSRNALLKSDLWSLSYKEGLHGLVAIARGQTPDPIPNSAVKTLSADGTAP